MEKGGWSKAEALETTLEALTESARQIGLISQDFQPRSQETLQVRLQSLVTGLQDLDAAKHAFQDVKVPLSVLGYLDSGKNPLLATEESLRRSLERNKDLNGKLELYRKFRASLLAELRTEMPADAATYTSCRANNPLPTDNGGGTTTDEAPTSPPTSPMDHD